MKQDTVNGMMLRFSYNWLSQNAWPDLFPLTHTPTYTHTLSLSFQVINLGAKLTLTVGPDTVGIYHCRAAVPGFPEVSTEPFTPFLSHCEPHANEGWVDWHCVSIYIKGLLVLGKAEGCSFRQIMILSRSLIRVLRWSVSWYNVRGSQ